MTEQLNMDIHRHPHPPRVGSREKIMDFPGGSHGKESVCNAGDTDSIPGLGKSPGEGIGDPLRYSCLGNLKDRGAWEAIVHGVARVRDNLATKPSLPPPIIMKTLEPNKRVN